jgi:predicted transcriptional regulator
MAMFIPMATVSFNLPESMIARLDAVAEAQDRTRSAQLRRLLAAGLSETAVTPPTGAAGTGFDRGRRAGGALSEGVAEAKKRALAAMAEELASRHRAAAMIRSLTEGPAH